MRPAWIPLLLTACLWTEAAIAQAPPMPVQQVSPHGYYVQGQAALGSASNQNFISNAGFVIAPDGVVVIDALGSPELARRLVQAIRQLTPKPITHVIVTHYHADHIYGLQTLKAEGAHILAQRGALEYIHSETARLRLQASRNDLAPWIDQNTQIIEADTWLAGSTTLRLAGADLVIEHVGPSHTPEDLTVYWPSEKLLFAGDLVFNGRLPFVGKADSSQWILALDQLLRHDTVAMVPGHGAASLEPQRDMAVTRDYLKYLRQTMGQAVEDFVPFDAAYAQTDWSRFAAMPMFGPANRMNAYNTYLLLEEEALQKKR